MVRHYLARTMKNSFFLVHLHNAFYKIKNRKKFWKEINTRSQKSIFDYKELVKPIPFYPLERTKDSNFYGQAYTLKQYAGIDKFDWSIEHGLYYDTHIPFAARTRTTERIMTFSEVRVKCLESIHKPVVAIGPYIHYAKSLLSDDKLVQLKEKLGKTLLFFPTHTCREGGIEYNINKMITALQQFKEERKFDTVIVNIYYLDELKNGFGSNYEKAGFKVTTAGHQLDINFLNRLKTIMLLADYTCSNSVGTHTGYCTYLNIPHLIINPAESLDNVEPVWKNIWKAYEGNTKEDIEEQWRIAHKFWGFDFIKSKEEMKSLLLKNE